MSFHANKHKYSQFHAPCKQYFIDNHIPYNDEVWIDNKQAPQIDFIIPGAVVRFPCPSNIGNINHWDKKMSKLEKVVPENIKIYFYCVTMPRPYVMEVLSEYPNLIVVDKFEDIKPFYTKYYQKSSGKAQNFSSEMRRRHK